MSEFGPFRPAPSQVVRVYFSRETGQILGCDNCSFDAPRLRPDDGMIFEFVQPNFETEIVDLDRETVRSMTADEHKMLNCPGIISITVRREEELRETDWLENQADWKIYRQQIRDLPDAGDVPQMLAAWPVRPDGRDAIASLREFAA